MELDLQSLFGLLSTAVLIGWDPPPPPAFGLIYESATGQPDRRHIYVTPWGYSLVHSAQSMKKLNVLY